ncbi:MAG: tripartite tricarboxylate transporter TctB family protein [Syntrophaceae bacterium]|nr:tripartite tricarboxylate transporter TctB family protein [Syntrophaceae bacterium]
MKREDIGIGVGLLILSTWLFWYVGRYRVKEIYGYGPDFFPRVLAVMMAILGLSLIVNALLGNSLKMGDRIDPKGFVRMLISIAICIGYLILTNILGFATATFLFLFGLMTFLRQKGILVRLFSSVATAILVWSIFRYFLVIPLPEGLLF